MSQAGAFQPQSQSHWVCPCGSEPGKPGRATPAGTVVSLLYRECPFCGRKFEEEYRRGGGEAA